jgi:hypothetical protein
VRCLTHHLQWAEVLLLLLPLLLLLLLLQVCCLSCGWVL